MEEKEVYLFASCDTPEGAEAEKILKEAGIVFTSIPTEGMAPMVSWGADRFGHNPRASIKDFIEIFLKEKNEPPETSPTPEEREVGRRNAQKYLEELYRQLERILDARKDYLSYTGKNKEKFMVDYIDPLRDAILGARDLPDFSKVKSAGNMPLVFVLPRQIVSLGAQAYRIEIDGENGDPLPFVSARFNNVVTMKNAYPLPYLIVDVNNGRSMSDVAPSEAAILLGLGGRTTLGLDEGVGLLTHFPETLKSIRMLLGIVYVEGVAVVPFFYADRRTATFSVMHAVDGRNESWGTASYGMRIVPEEIVEAISAANDQGGGGTFCAGCGYTFENGSWEQMEKLMADRLNGRIDRCPGCKKKVRFLG